MKSDTPWSPWVAGQNVWATTTLHLTHSDRVITVSWSNFSPAKFNSLSTMLKYMYNGPALPHPGSVQQEWKWALEKKIWSASWARAHINWIILSTQVMKAAKAGLSADFRVGSTLARVGGKLTNFKRDHSSEYYKIWKGRWRIWHDLPTKILTCGFTWNSGLLLGAQRQREISEKERK